MFAAFGKGEPLRYLRRRHNRQKVVAAVSRLWVRLQANMRAEHAFLRKGKNDDAYDWFFCKEKSEWSKVRYNIDEVTLCSLDKSSIWYLFFSMPHHLV